MLILESKNNFTQLFNSGCLIRCRTDLPLYGTAERYEQGRNLFDRSPKW